jgi:hypothetical protein
LKLGVDKVKVVYQIRLVPLQGMVELEVTHRVGSKFLKVMFLPFLWVEPVQTELEVTTVVEMVVITFTVPEGELLISALVGYWRLIEFWLPAVVAVAVIRDVLMMVQFPV